jgi:hypothetical protein
VLKEITVKIVGLIGFVLHSAGAGGGDHVTLLSVAGHVPNLEIPVGTVQKIRSVDVNGKETKYTPNLKLHYGSDGSQYIDWNLAGYRVSFSGVETGGVKTYDTPISPQDEVPVFGDIRHPQWGDLAWLPDLRRAYKYTGTDDYSKVTPYCFDGDVSKCASLAAHWQIKGGTLRTESSVYKKYQTLPFTHGKGNRHVFANGLVWKSNANGQVFITLTKLKDDGTSIRIYMQERQASDLDDDEPTLVFSNLPMWNGQTEDTGVLDHFTHFHGLTVKTPDDIEEPCSLTPAECEGRRKANKAARLDADKKRRADVVRRTEGGDLFAEPIICPPARLYR